MFKYEATKRLWGKIQNYRDILGFNQVTCWNLSSWIIFDIIRGIKVEISQKYN